MADRALIARELAAALLGGVWTRRRLVSRCNKFLGKRAPKTVRRLIDHVLLRVPTAYPPSPQVLAQILESSPYLDASARRLLRADRLTSRVLRSAVFTPIPALADLPVPKLATPGDLAAWLELPIAHLDWFADTRGGNRRAEAPALEHYTGTFVPKRSGPPRLLEAPKPRLKAVQRRILHEMLDHIAPHPSAHGFVRGRSCISGAKLHAGEHVVVKLDLRRFFPSIQAARIHRVFRAIGYPWAVARLLTGLCTTRTPAAVLTPLNDWHARKDYAAPHLP
jgi:hypothetical protein